MTRVIVTGAEGFIGRSVVDELTRVGNSVSHWAQPVVSQARYAEPADVVVHLAASSRYGELKTEVGIDVPATEAVLQYCRLHRARCIFASTAGVYRSAATQQAEEASTDPRNAYAIGKLAAEECCRRASDQLGLSCTVLRLFNVYGPGQRPPFLVPYVVECIAADRPLDLKMPNAVRDFVYVVDVARAFAAAVDRYRDDYHVINIGSGKGTRVSELVESVGRLLGKSPSWNVAEGCSPEIRSSIADIRRACADLGWTPTVPLEAGLNATCENHEQVLHPSGRP